MSKITSYFSPAKSLEDTIPSEWLTSPLPCKNPRPKRPVGRPPKRKLDVISVDDDQGFNVEPADIELTVKRGKYKRYSVAEKMEILKVADSIGVSAVSDRFNIPASTISTWRKKLKVEKDKGERELLERKTGSGRTVSYPMDLEMKLVTWIIERRDIHLPVSRECVKKEALKVIRPSNPEFKASNGWLEKFMRRNQLSTRRPTSLSQKLPEDLDQRLSVFYKHLREVAGNVAYDEDMILNMDEVPMVFEVVSKKTVDGKAKKDVKLRTAGGEKKHFTVVLCVAADGTILPSMIIFKGEKSILVPGVVPSVFPFKPEKSPSQKRRAMKGPRRTSVLMDLNIDNVGNEEIVETSQLSPPKPSELCESTHVEHSGVQCSIYNDSFSIEKFMFQPQAIQFYTSFDDYDHFMLFFNILGEAAYNLNLNCTVLSPSNQLFLTLMKLRQAKEDTELSFLFGVSTTLVSLIVNTWINFLYFQLKEINMWPSKQTVVETMPENFKQQFPATRVILDATEIPIQKPSNVRAQSATFSTSKNKNTLKTMIGCTPRGLISYISNSYGGSASDRQIMERSTLCISTKQFFQKGDSIMADRGIMVQDLFAPKDVHINTPTMLKGKSQLEPEEVVNDRRVASKRIHIEREIGLGKTFKILKKDLPPSKIPLGERIVFICFTLNNFRKSIVGILA